MYFSRFDIVEAYYVYATLWHGGQWTPEYAILGRLERMGFKPGLHVENKLNEGLSENGFEIYASIVRRREGCEP